jgi:hypothetical protein
MNSTTEQKIRQRQKRVSFPYISIKDAVAYAEKLKAYKNFGLISIRDALLKMGYKPSSSSADRALSAMVKSYGLLDQQGTKKNNGMVQLTQLAKKILLLPQDSEERINAITQAVLKDELMQKVFDKWAGGDGVPQRKEIITELQLDPRFDEFTQDAAIRFATVIQETFEFLDPSKYNGTDVQNDFDEGDDMLTQDISKQDKTPPPVGTTDYALPLAGGKRKVVLRAPNGLTEKEFDRIIQWLNVIKDGLLEDEQQETKE